MVARLAEATDKNGNKLKSGDCVRLTQDGRHKWLKKGSVFKVDYWEDRSGMFRWYPTGIVVFLRTLKGNRLISMGIDDIFLEKVEKNEE